MLFGEFNNNTNSYCFVFGDLRYFDWFKNGEHFEDNKVERFRNVLVWKRLIYYTSNNRLGNTWNDSQIANLDAYPVVARAFLNHLREPLTFPIFDKHVWRAMRVLTPEIANFTPDDPKNVQFEEHYLGEYQSFFDRLYENESDIIIAPQIDGVDNEIVKRRVLDRALWLYGKILDNNRQTQFS